MLKWWRYVRIGTTTPIEEVRTTLIELLCASAFDRLYYLEEVCKRQVLAMSTNRPMQYVPPEVVQQLSEDEELFDAYAEKHLTAIKRVLSREEPEFAQ